MKTAILNDWLVTYAGSERVMEQIIKLYPDSDLFSLIDFLPKGERDFILNKDVKTSFLQKIPFVKKNYRSFLPFMPYAIEQFDFTGYDLIISSSHAVAKGILTNADQLHICYCHTPIRYAWDLYHQYLREAGLTKGIKGSIAKRILHYIRIWDAVSANRVDHYVANSKHTAKRIRKIYNKEATVIYPPVDTDKFELHENKEDFYLTVSRMVPYKKVDLIVEAFSAMPEKKLIVIGDGPDYKKVRKRAKNNVELLGFKSAGELQKYMGKAKAFVFAAEEDFGIVPVEAQSCGTPVIAYGKGGAAETVIDGVTGVLFYEQSVLSLIDAVKRFEESAFDPHEIRKNAERFSCERFQNEFKLFVESTLTNK